MERPKKQRKKILFVCTGNTCRSPMAEGLLRKKLKERKIKFVDVASAGLAVSETEMNPYSRKTLADHGIVMPKFKPRQLTEKLLKNAFVVITMTEGQKRQISTAYAEKVYSLADVAQTEVPDPYGQGWEAYQAAYRSLDEATDRIVASVWG